MAAALIHQKINKHASEDTIYHCLYGFYFLGMKKSQLAKTYARDKKTISNWVEKFEKTGSVSRAKATSDMYRKFNAEKRAWVVNLFKERPILYQQECVRLFMKEFKEHISTSTISVILHEAGLTWKTLERRAIQLQIKDVIRFYNELASINWMLHSLVFLDEVSFDNADMIRRRGYAIKGQKLIFRGEFCRKPRVSLLCFLGINGIVDCFSTPGTFDRLKFADCCKKFALEHSRLYPGQNSLWILDGAAIHCDANITIYLRSLGIIPIFLPAYAPFYNPIEIVFGLLKRELKKIYSENSKYGSDFYVGKAIKSFFNKDMKKLFKKCGYTYNGHFDPAIGLCQELKDLGFD